MTERFGFKTLINEDEVFGLCVFPVGSNNFDEFSNEQTALTPKQTHSLNVGIVEYPWETFEDTDALVTFREDCPIGVCTADCVPILLYAPDIKGAAAVHAGWRGSLGGIVDNTLDILEKRGADLGKLTVAFGPSISAAKYEVDQNLADKFIEAGFSDFVTYPDGNDRKPHIDLQGVNIERLIRRGVIKENIKPSDECTFDSILENGVSKYQSYRRDGDKAGRMVTAIGMHPGMHQRH